MAENINLGSFDFDTDKLIQSLAQLRSQMDAAKKVTTDLKAEAKQLTQGLVEQQQNMAKLEQQGKKNTKEYSDAEKAAGKLNNQLTETNKKIIEQESAVKSINSEYKETSKVLNSQIEQNVKYTSTLEQANSTMERQVKTIAEARASNTELLAVRNRIDLSTAEGVELLAKLNKKIDENNEFIKANVSAFEQQKLNIGNYSESIKTAFEDLNIFNMQGLLAFVKTSEASGGAGKALSTTFSSIKTGIVGMTKAALAFIATPFGAVITAISLVVMGLYKALTSTGEGMRLIKDITTPLSAALDVLSQVVTTVGRGLVTMITKPKEGFEWIYKFVKDNIIPIFENYGKIIIGIATLDFGKVKEGLTGLRDSAVGAYEAVSGAIEENVKARQEMLSRDREIGKLQRERLVANAQETQDQLKFREIIKDTSKTTAERTAAIKESKRLMDERITQERKILDLQLAQLDAKYRHNKEDKDYKNERAQIVASMIDSQTQEIRNNLELMEGENKIRAEAIALQKQQEAEAKQRQKEAADNAKRQAEEAFNISMQRMSEEMDLFVANQGFRKKSLQEEFEFEKKLSEDKINILKFQLSKNKISQEKYTAEVKKIQNDLAVTQAELIVQNADDEVEAWVKANVSILEGKRILTDELITAENERLTKEEEIRTEAERVRFENGLTTQREFDEASLAITEDVEMRRNEIKNRAANEARQQALVAQQLDFEEDMSAMLLRGATQFEIKQEQLDQQNEVSILKLEQDREQRLISEDEYQRRLNLIETEWSRKTAENKTEMEMATQTVKQNIARQTFTIIGGFAEKESAAGKAFAIAQTTIDTYQSAVAAYKFVVGIGGPILASISAGLAVASGLMNVRKILSVKLPSMPGFATGGEINGGVPIQRDNGDDVLITAKKGEIILNETQQRRAGGDSFFRAIGVPGFATGGVVGSNLKTVQNALTSTMTAEEVYNAVKAGSMAGTAIGSQDGIRGLSIDRAIANSSSF